MAHGEAVVEDGILLQVAYFQAVAEYYAATVGIGFAANDVEERAFARAVFGDEGCLLVFQNGERDALKQHLVAESLGEILHLEVCDCCHDAKLMIYINPTKNNMDKKYFAVLC